MLPQRSSHHQIPAQRQINGCSTYIFFGFLAILFSCTLGIVMQEIEINPLTGICTLQIVCGVIAGCVWLWLQWRKNQAIEAHNRWLLWNRWQVDRASEAHRRQQLWRRWQADKAAEAQQRHAAYVARLGTLQGLQSPSPTDFELAVQELLKSWGYPEVRHTGGGGDLAADLICRDTAGYMTVVQCKRYASGNLVGSPEIQKFVGMIFAHHRAHHGIFVTTSGYTQPALNLARQHNIRTIDGNELVSHVQQWRATVQQGQQPRQSNNLP